MDLLDRLKKLTDGERRITLELLHLLREAEDTKLYSRMAYASLFDFCVKELRYSEGAAYRRISAMRLLRENEALGEKLLSGAISLSVATRVERVFRAGGLGDHEKRQLLREVEGLSRRQAEVKLRPYSLEKSSSPHSELKALSSGRYQLSLYLDQLVVDQLEKLRSIWSHRSAAKNYRALLEELLSGALRKFENPAIKSVGCAGDIVSRHIPAALKRLVWERDRGRCTYTDPITGKRCEAKFLLQYDHITPHALGGTTTEKNLRLLCRAHNLLLAEQAGLPRPHPPKPNAQKPTAPALLNTSS